jgi:hypothetical protein
VRLALIFVGTFLGILLLIAGGFVLFKAMGKLVEWLKLKTGRSEPEVMIFVYVVFMALVTAASFTAAIAAGEKS